jgi:NADH-quinone oxidoreductase subunit K
MITAEHYLILSIILFVIGIMGVLLRRNVLLILLSLEVVFNATNLAFVAFSRLHGNLDGQVIVLFTMAVAAAEVTIALAITVLLFRNWQSIRINEPSNLKG